jgi:hypothetical protein
VFGRKNDFATVAQFDNKGLRAEFAWETVARVMNENGGKFRM